MLGVHTALENGKKKCRIPGLLASLLQQEMCISVFDVKGHLDGKDWCCSDTAAVARCLVQNI